VKSLSELQPANAIAESMIANMARMLTVSRDVR
jgi:hypothetical protein